MIRRTWKTREQLEEAGLRLKVNYETNEYTFYQHGDERKPITVCRYHKFGKTIKYQVIPVYIGGKVTTKTGKSYYRQSFILAHVFVWLWVNGSIGDGMDIDHIDNNTMNYHIENLQEITHKDNLAKRGCGFNQYTAGMTAEQVFAMRAEKQAKRAEREHARKIRKQAKQIKARRLDTVRSINDEMRKLKAELPNLEGSALKLQKLNIKALQQKKAVANWYCEEELNNIKEVE